MARNVRSRASLVLDRPLGPPIDTGEQADHRRVAPDTRRIEGAIWEPTVVQADGELVVLDEGRDRVGKGLRLPLQQLMMPVTSSCESTAAICPREPADVSARTGDQRVF